MRFERLFGEGTQLEGMKIEVGEGDTPSMSASIDIGPLEPREYRGALPFAHGPSGGKVVYGFTNRLRSEVHVVDTATGADAVAVRLDDVISDAAYDPASESLVYLLLERGTLQPKGVFAIAAAGTTPLLAPWADSVPDRGSWRATIAGLPSEGLVVATCGDDVCSYWAGRSDGVAPTLLADGLADRGTFGVAARRLLIGSECDLPCAATSLDLDTGAVGEVGSYCQAGVIIDVGGEPAFVSDGAPRCNQPGFTVTTLGLTSGQSRQSYHSVLDEPSLAGREGWELAPGWFLLVPGGDATSPEPEAGQRTAVESVTGIAVTLPSLP